MMKKLLPLFLFFWLGAIVWAQTTPPPPHADDEDKPIDLSIGEPKRKITEKKPTQETTPPPTPVPTPPISTPPETPVPGPVPTQPATPEPAPLPVPAPVPAPIPAPVTPPVPTPPATSPLPTPPSMEEPTPVGQEPPTPTVPPSMIPTPLSEISGDGGFKNDAGADLTSAFPVTYHKYEESSLSPQDRIDIYKFYARMGEGIGVILIPQHPSMQLAVELLGEGEILLSQTQAPQPGAPLSFQTSPLDKNTVIYLKVKDNNLMPASPPTELRKYSLELKPIAAPPPPSVSPPAVETPPPAEISEEPKEEGAKAVKKERPLLLYGLIGIAVLMVTFVALMMIRKRKQEIQNGEENP